MGKSRAWALDILKNQPNVKITHRYFDSDEYIYGKEDGNVYDEKGYLFEDWESHRFSGMRMRSEGVWEDGWDYCTLKPYQHQESSNEDFFECQNEYLDGNWCC